ncbi:MAG TPA: tetratricopeptide repeat protein [Blastocatellia bacterium]|nr:tetratricopeptide repeat protein [Blastocatellia bacterium]
MSNAFYQGISWLTKKAFVYALIGLGIGLIAGFKLANSQYRRQLNANTAAEALQAATRVQGGKGAVSVTGGATQQSEQIINQTRAIIEKARQSPNDFEAQMQAAEQFMQIRRPEGALEFLQQANKLKPEDGEVMSELAGAYFFQEKFADAITWARRTLGKTPDNPPAKFYLAYSLIMSRQNLKEAEQLLTQLEASSVNAPESAREALAEMRERLQQAKQEGTSGKAGEAKSTLSHGPEEKSAAGGKK